MKSIEELKKMLFAILKELQDGRTTKNNAEFKYYLQTRLDLLYDILGDEVPEEYWSQIEEALK